MYFKVDRFPYSSLQVFQAFSLGLIYILAMPSKDALILGLTISLVGMFFRTWASGYPSSQKFFVFGPYRFLRHPHHLGSFLIFLGGAIASRSVWAIGWVMVGTALLYRYMYKEEDIFSKTAGVEFKQYRQQMSSFIPNLIPWPVSKDYSKKFSLSYSMLKGKRRELDVLIALLVTYGILYSLIKMDYPLWLQFSLGLTIIAAFICRGFFVIWKKNRLNTE
tara:strand:- start:664 stop:1323 length:660 start_codon:yes stop_codon:yes gene_type:complete